MKEFIHITLFLVFVTLLNNNGFSQTKPARSLTATQVNTLVDSLFNLLRNHYIYSDKAKAMVGYLNDQLKRGNYKDFADPNKLAAKLESDIRHINYDSHLHVAFEPDLRAPKELSAAERKQAIAEQLVGERENNFNFRKAEVLPGNIGYLRIDGFTGLIEEARPTLKGSLAFLSNTKALIIDLRFNGGGSNIEQFSSYFFKHKEHLFDQISTFSTDTISLFTDPKVTDDLTLLMPVYILISKKTASAAEAFAAALQGLKRAVLIGDTTLGASHMTAFFSMGQGFIAKVPFARPISTSSFKDWEGTGVIPDISIPALNALQKTQTVIFQDLLAKANNDKEKRTTQWAINTLNAEQNLSNPPVNVLNKYTGVYTGGINFYIEAGNLLCRNPERGGTDVFKMKTVSDHTFLLDENAQIEFVKDASGKYSSLKMLWKDGNITEKSKEK
ncbi:S41 family peptidase [Pedobacter nyackensis]|uniref:N-terminal domain of Peptidase_S41 n=1 Tax=Pedobacter nyackensis TaxID=475255 RepID=A0A1W2FB08_9SPHI|nr:S41 family peptidase [Pedobacter nyackensis]SMD18756.1 N-terminal domain of Peptidase_S41 [Pedobacter nyackensis]